MKKISTLTTIIMLMGLFTSIIASAYSEVQIRNPKAHPFDTRKLEPHLNPTLDFGYQYENIQGDFRATFGQSGRTERRNAILAYTELSIAGATSLQSNPTSLILQPRMDSEGNAIEDLQDKTGYIAYYLGRDETADVTNNLNLLIGQYAPFYNGNVTYLKERIIPKFDQMGSSYNLLPENDYPELNKEGVQYGSKDMIINVGQRNLFYNLAYIQALSGAGKVVVGNPIPERYETRDEYGNLVGYESNESYYAQPMRSYQVSSSYWPSITSFKQLSNGDVEYTVNTYGVNGTSGKADLIGNFETNKSKLPSLELDTLDEYWRKHMFDYYQDLILNQSTSDAFKKYAVMLEDIPYTNRESQTITKTIPASQVQGLLNSSRTDNKITLYVTDMFGRYVSQTIPYTFAEELPNLKVRDLFYDPVTIQPGNRVNLSVKVTNDHSEPITTELVARVAGTQIGKKTITLGANESKPIRGFSFIAPDQPSVNVEFEVNPTKSLPNNETSYSDNKVSRSVSIQQEENLYVHLRNVPSPVASNDYFDVTVVAGNESSNELTTTVKVVDDYIVSERKCSGVGLSRTCWYENESKTWTNTKIVTIPAKNQVVYTLRDLPAGWNYFDTKFEDGEAIPLNKHSITIKATINESRTIQETNYSDNTFTKAVKVNALSSPRTKPVLIY